VGYKSEDNAFTAGLLHDIGKNVLDKVMHDEFMKALQSSRDESRPLWEAERQYCGVDHAYVGGLLAEIWNLPSDLRFAVCTRPMNFAARLAWAPAGILVLRPCEAK
jgi:HD-like signal output (HDOD) protein